MKLKNPPRSGNVYNDPCGIELIQMTILLNGPPPLEKKRELPQVIKRSKRPPARGWGVGNKKKKKSSGGDFGPTRWGLLHT